MIRESEWIVAVVLASIIAGALFAAAATVDDAGLRAIAFWGAVGVAMVVAVSANVFGYVVPRYQGSTGALRRRCTGWYCRLARHDTAPGVELLWLAAGLAFVLLALQPEGTPVILALGTAAFLAATVAWLWGDFVNPAAGQAE